MSGPLRLDELAADGPSVDKSATDAYRLIGYQLMALVDFQSSLRNADPPPAVRAPLLALWHEAKGAWTRAHAVVQDEDDADSAWVHAYLHRKEGDLSNAAYWYRRASKPVFKGTLVEEWETIVATLLAQP